MDGLLAAIIPFDGNARPILFSDGTHIVFVFGPPNTVTNIEDSIGCRSYPPLMRAINCFGAEEREPYGFISRSRRLFWSIGHLHNGPLMRAI
jgi:hypothetical protein